MSARPSDLLAPDVVQGLAVMRDRNHYRDQAAALSQVAIEARALVAALQGMAVHPSHYAALVAALDRVGGAA